MTADERLTAPELLQPRRTQLTSRLGVADPDSRGNGLALLAPPAPGQRPPVMARLVATFGPSGWPAVAYSGSRLLLLLVAGLVAVAGHRSFGSGFFLFDGQWYLRLVEHGYPAQALHTRSTLGFFPLYPLAIRMTAWATGMSLGLAALATSMAGGLVAALLVQRLATSWWGAETGGWATLLFSLFPGSIVFSMAYSEGLTVPLALGCLLALRSRRWWAAGLLAGLATAVEPIAVVLIVVCLTAAVRELRSRGWRDPLARRSLLAPLLAPLGIGGFAVFLWVWTGTPWAAYLAQHYGWHQQSEPLALLALPVVQHLAAHPAQMIARVLIWNNANGLLGGVFLAFSIMALVRVRRELTSGALLLTVGVAAVTVWSVMTPPNARMVLVAFPAVLVWARRLAGRRRGLFAAAEAAVLVFASALTFSGHMLP